MATVYNTPRWRTLRHLVLERDGHTCQTCGAHATTVHHTTPFVDANDPHAWDPTHMHASCLACNGREGGVRRHARRAHAA